MKILALVRAVPDVEETLRLRDNAVDPDAGKLVLDTMDEYGVEEALRLREAGAEAEIIAVAIGTARAEDALRTSLAMGADRAVLVDAPAMLDVIALSAVIAKIASEEAAELIFCGGQQADWDSQALGPAVAERLGWPAITWTTDLTLEGNTLRGTHDVEGGRERFEVALPAVVTTQQGLNDPRYPTLPNIMKSKRKEIRRQSLADFAVEPLISVVNATIQKRHRAGRIIDSKDPQAAAAELVKFLRNEAKVIQ